MAELSLQQATMIVEAALRKARETSCAPLAVAVLDGGGHLKAFAREDGAGIIRPPDRHGKGLGRARDGRRLPHAGAPCGRAAPAAGLFLGAQRHVAGTGRPGGVLIRDASGAVIRAVGISGDVSDKDEACALAGIAAAKLVGDTG